MSLAVEFPLSNERFEAAQPQYSIVVPAYNERERIGGTLEQVLKHIREQNWSADRIGHLAFDPEVIESERGVVASERRLSVDDNNHGHLAEQVQAAAFVAHPYQFPTIGWPADIQSWQLRRPAEVLPHLLRAEQPDVRARRRCVAREKCSRSRASISSRFRARPRRSPCAR